MRMKTAERQMTLQPGVVSSRTMVINPNALDCICMPAHKLREGEIEEAQTEHKVA